VTDLVKIRIRQKQEEIKAYSKQLAQGYIDEKLFLELSEDSKKELERLEKHLSEMENVVVDNEDEKENIIDSLNMLEEIIKNNNLSNSDISILIDKIILRETVEMGEYNKPKLHIEIVWNAPFIVLNSEIKDLEKVSV
jgi:site-specific DNA recombinase